MDTPGAYRASERAAARSDARAKRTPKADEVIRRVVAVARILRNSPSPTRDTLELRLECGHRYPWLRPASGPLLSSSEAVRLLGSELPCSHCSTLRRMRSQDEPRRSRSRRQKKFLQPRV